MKRSSSLDRTRAQGITKARTRNNSRQQNTLLRAGYKTTIRHSYGRFSVLGWKLWDVSRPRPCLIGRSLVCLRPQLWASRHDAGSSEWFLPVHTLRSVSSHRWVERPFCSSWRASLEEILSTWCYRSVFSSATLDTSMRYATWPLTNWTIYNTKT